MAVQRAIGMALDLARMPAFAHSMSSAPLPEDLVHVMCIAAADADSCRAASLATGMSEDKLIEASRFYLQQVLFRPGADCYRILGVRPGDSRAAARTHMGWLLQWLHPDRNSGLDAVYAKRVVKAWREISKDPIASENSRPTREGRRGSGRRRSSYRVPMFERPPKGVAIGPGKNLSRLTTRMLKLAAGLFTLFLLLGLTATASGRNPLSLSLWFPLF